MLPFRYTQMGRWWGKTKIANEQGKLITKENEVDIVAVDNDKSKYLIGECKFKKSAFSYKDYLEITKKMDLNKAVVPYYWLFSRSGFDEKIVNEAKKVDNITLCNFEDIVEYISSNSDI